MTVDLKALSQDATFNLDAVLFGADSQAASAPSVFNATTVWTFLRAQDNTWSGTNTFTGVVDLAGASVTYSANIEAIEGLAVTDGGIIVGNGTTFVLETGATARASLGVTIGTNVQAYAAVLTGTTASFTTALDTKLAGIEALADVTDTANVTAAGALMDSEVDANLKTLALPATTTISAFGATVIDDADATAARTTLGAAATSHNHNASAINAGTLTHERGGLELDVSAADGFPEISGGSTTIRQSATVAHYRGNTAAKVLTTDKVWSAMASVALTDGANISLDLSTGIDFTLAITGNRTLDNPTNTKVGQRGSIKVTQDGTGSRTLAYGTSYKFAGGTDAVLSTAANTIDYLDYHVVTSTEIRVGFSGAWS